MKVCIVGPNLPDQSKGSFIVCKKGCGELRKYAAMFPGDTSYGYVVFSKQDVVTSTYDPGDFGYDEDSEWRNYLGEFYFNPCCADLPDTAA